jgi:EAL domain-containing protein (putative c-di-GMP-specific phosphodiesterase class I)
VLSQACHDAARWRSEEGPLHINVNLSASQLKHEGLVDEVAAVLVRTALEPSALTLEITETLLMEDPERAAAVIGELKSLGVKIALDDFGTGFSSLSYLSRFPVDSLKIDKSFVDALAGGGSTDDVSLVRAITGIGAMLNLQITAEGIERPGQLAELLGLGCHLGQGFHFAKAVDHAEFTQMLHASRPRSAAAPRNGSGVDRARP